MSILESSMAFYDQPVEVPLQSMDQSSHSPTQIQRKESDSLLDMGAGGVAARSHCGRTRAMGSTVVFVKHQLRQRRGDCSARNAAMNNSHMIFEDGQHWLSTYLDFRGLF